MRPNHDVPFFEKEVWITAIGLTFSKFSPKRQIQNPVFFIVYIGTLLATFFTLKNWSDPAFFFNALITAFLWITLWLANFAEALAEAQAKRYAAELRQAKVTVRARVLRQGKEYKEPVETLKKGDIVLCEVGDIIPADGVVIEGIATIDESAITGESAPVIRESGGDRSAVTSGTKVLGDRIIIRITSEKGETFLDHTINLIEGANRQKTAGEQMLNFYLISFNLIFLLTILSLKFFENYAYSGSKDFILTVPVLIVLFVSLVPKTIAALMRCTVISAIIRLSRENLILKSGRSLEDSADVDVLLLDKTGTITLGNREATDFIPAEGFTELQLAELAQLASIADETPEGRSVVILAKNRFGLRGEKIDVHRAHFIPFSNKSRMSGVDYYNAQGNMTLSVRKGAVDAIKDHVRSLGGHFPDQIETDVEKIVHQGSTPLAVCIFNRIAGVICLKDKIRGKLKERFLELREMGIRTVMITNDNPLTAAAIAAEAGVDDFVAEATPEIKLKLVRDEQKNGQLVAMTGDGISDVPALAQADVGLALSTGTEATREASNIIDLDSNPTKILEAVIASKQMLMTWGAITTYSLSSAIAKYFAILPAIFRYESPLQVLNIMHLHSPKSAILSTAIFNAIFIAFLIPLAIKGVPYQSGTADAILRKNLLIYGISGLVFPFIIIKCIDSALVFWGVI